MTKNMMHLSVKIKDKPLKIDIRSYYTTPRTLKFENGVIITDAQISKWIKKHLETKLAKIQRGVDND